ncbi:hypothetical protein Tco_0146521 [Tanacetum coccineum]
MLNPKDISDPTIAMNMELLLMAKAFKLNYSTPTKNNQRISSNPRNREITQLGMNMGQDRQMQMVTGNGGYRFRQLIVVLGIANQNADQNGNGNVLAARAEVRLRRRDVTYIQTKLLIAQKEEVGIQLQAEEFDLMAAVEDLDEIKEVNANCILMANLQQASTLGTQTDNAPVYDSDGSAEVHHFKNCYNNDIFNMFTQEEQYTELLEPISEPHQVQQNDGIVISAVSSMEQSGGTIEQHPATFEETQIEHLLRAIISQDIMSIVQSNSVVDTSNLQTELELSEQKDTPKGTSGNTKLAKQIIIRKQPSSSGTKLYSVTPLLKSKFIPKVVESNALSKLVTSHSVPNTRESKVVKNDNVIAPRMFRINPSKTSMVDNVMPNKPVKASVRTKLITVSQPHVITKKDVNSNTNGLPFT